MYSLPPGRPGGGSSCFSLAVASCESCVRDLTFDMSGGPKGARRPLERPLDGIRRDFPPSSNGVEAPRLSCDHQSETEKGKPMFEITRGVVGRVGADRRVLSQ